MFWVPLLLHWMSLMLCACSQATRCLSVCHWIFSSFGSAPAFPSYLLLLHQATYWKSRVEWARENRTQAEQIREKGKRKQKETWLIKIRYSLCWSYGPRKLRSQSKQWGWKQPGANETALLEKALNESHGALGTDIFLNTKCHFPPPPWKWAGSLGRQLVQHPLLCSSAWHSWCRNPRLPGCPATISPSATASCLLPQQTSRSWRPFFRKLLLSPSPKVPEEPKLLQDQS